MDTNVWITLEQIVSDKDRLLDGLRGYQSQQESKIEPIRRELALVEKSILEKTTELDDELLNMKLLSSERAKAKTALDIAQLEQVLDGLEARKANLLAQLEVNTLTEEQMQSIFRFAYKLARDIATLRKTEMSGIATPELKLKVFEAKRKLLELLDVQVTLFMQDGKHKGLMTAKFCAEGENFIVELDNFYKHNRNHKNWVIISIEIDLE